MKKVTINVNKFVCPEDDKTIIKKYEKEIINNMGEKENILVCDIFLEPLKGVRYDGTNKDDAMLALLGADSFREMREIANGDKTLMEIINALEDVLNDEVFIKKYGSDVKDDSDDDDDVEEYDEGVDDGVWAEKFIIGRRLINKGFDYDFISEIVDLSVDEMKRIERGLS